MTLKDEMVRPRDTWYCAGVVVRARKVLLVHTTGQTEYPNGYVKTVDQWKFPGGTVKYNEGRGDRSPEDTLRAEFAEEVFADDSGIITDWKPLVSIEKKNRNGGIHKVYFSEVEISGVLRTEDIFEPPNRDEQGRVHTEILHPPVFVRVYKAAKIIFPSHARALEKVCGDRAAHCDDFNAALYALNDRGLI